MTDPVSVGKSRRLLDRQPGMRTPPTPRREGGTPKVRRDGLDRDLAITCAIYAPTPGDALPSGSSSSPSSSSASSTEVKRQPAIAGAPGEPRITPGVPSLTVSRRSCPQRPARRLSTERYWIRMALRSVHRPDDRPAHGRRSPDVVPPKGAPGLDRRPECWRPCPGTLSSPAPASPPRLISSWSWSWHAPESAFLWRATPARLLGFGGRTRWR